jgi:ATP synthase protein I
MTDPDPQDGKAIDRLGDKLKAFEAKRGGGGGSSFGDESGVGEGYRLLGSLLGGVLGGVGFGWLFDKFAHTAPWGLIGGLLIGTFGGIFSVVRAASRMSDKAAATSGPAKPAPADDEED